MEIGILYSSEKSTVEKIAHGLKRGLEEQGQKVFIFSDISCSFAGLARCRHIFIGSFITSIFKAKTPQKLRDALSRAPGIGGKRSIAFVAGSGPGARKALVALMSDMEKQGCFIIDQRAFGSEKEAYEFGRNVTLKES